MPEPVDTYTRIEKIRYISEMKAALRDLPEELRCEVHLHHGWAGLNRLDTLTA